MNIPNYNILSIVFKNSSRIIYEAQRLEDKETVILKTHLSDYPTPQEVGNLNYEYNLLKEISSPGVILAHELIKTQNHFFLVLEAIKGKTLKDWVAGKPINLNDFFKVAIALAETLANLHSQNIIHKDIKPENILINPDTLKNTIIDFSLASKLSFETSNMLNPNVLEGTLAYLSPEQTGRMNRVIDQRTDFYSLGIMFYEMLTGRLPFESTDPLELVCAHLAKSATPVHEINDQIPLSLSHIIEKLMAKSSDARYLSGFGLKEDLLRCQKLWEEGNLSADFPLGQKEIKNRLILSQKLYGREEITKTLLNVFDRICEEGTGELTLVSGSPGIGKSAFIQEIYKPLSQRKGYFMRGKFDLLQRNISYFAFISAFKELMRVVLAESEQTLNVLKKDILEAIGINGQVVTMIIPELELIIGKQPPLAELQPQETQNRFNFVFQQFIKVFAKKEHPLVIFIDDLQWADQASLILIEKLLINTPYLFVIGAYRDNEVQGVHPLLLTLEALEKEKTPITTIKLEPLKQSDIDALLLESLGQSDIGGLSSLIFQKAGGNPFFINEFLKSIYQEGLLSISPQGIWEWDAEAINSKEMTSNVVDLLVNKIQKLPNETQEILALASCIGNEFNLDTIATVSQKDPGEVAKMLWQAVEAELILTIGSAYKQTNILDLEDSSQIIQYKFLHDRVQEAAYQLISVDKKKGVHLKIGRLLFHEHGQSSKHLFEILGHFNVSLDIITDKDERKNLSELNALGGKKAKDSSAYASALAYFEHAITLAPEKDWQNNYPFVFAIHRDYAECLYLVGRASDAEEALNTLLGKANSAMDKADIYSILVVQLTNIGRYEEAVKSGIAGLSLLGLSLPNPTMANLLKEIVILKTRLTFTGAFKRLEDLPPMTDPKFLKMTRLMYLMAAATFIYKPELHVIVGLKIVHMTINNGYSQGSILGFVCYLLIVIAKLNSYKEATFWAKLIAKYSEKTGHVDNYAYFCLAGFYDHWMMPYKDTLNDFNRSVKACMEEGDLNFLKYNSAVILSTHHNMGLPLSDLQKSCENTMDVFKNDFGFYDSFLLLHYLTDCLMTGNPINQEKANGIFNTVLSNPFGKTSYVVSYAKMAEACYLVGDYDKAIDLGKQGLSYADSALGLSSTIDMEFHYGLALAITLPQKTGIEKFSNYLKLKMIQKKFKRFAKQCPENHLHKNYFLDAELANLSGKHHLAGDLYEKAIEQAKTQDNLRHVAMASERAAEMYVKIGNNRLSNLYILECYYYYGLWGAVLKTNALEAKYPKILGKDVNLERTKSITYNSLNSNSLESHALDYLSVFKASRTISSEIVQDQLLKKMMRIVMENAGGQRGDLLLEKEGVLWVEAEGYIDQEEVNLTQQIATDRKDLPLSIFSYVQRTSESVVLTNALSSEFGHDPYIAEYKPISVLCSPIINKNRMIGLLYLENNLSEGAFTTERVEVLSLLSAQASISLENARLYEATGKFVPVQFLDQLGKRSLVDIRLGDQVQQSMSVLFCDIRNFTTISEKMSPAETFLFINEFLGFMEPHIKENNGFIDKYIGDAIMALFKGKASECVDAAIGMIRDVKRFNKETNRNIAIGIGINTGEIILGIMGGKEHLAGTVIGDSVNTASRIEAVTKAYGVQLLIGGKTKDAITNQTNYNLRLIDEVFVKGKTMSIEIWEVCDVDPDPVKKLKIETLGIFNQARSHYLASEFDKAAALFQQCIDKNPEDNASKVFLKRCKDGVIVKNLEK